MAVAGPRAVLSLQSQVSKEEVEPVSQGLMVVSDLEPSVL